jgi:hypothetical protein
MKKLVIVLGVAVLATGAVATNFWLGLRAEHRKAGEIATLLSAAESKQGAQAAATQSAVPAEPQVAVATAQPSAAPVPVEAVPASQQSAKGTADSPMKGMLEAMASPQGQDSMRAMMRGMMAQMYPDIEQELGLTRQEKDKLLDLLASEGTDAASLESAGLMFGGAQDAAATREAQRKMVEAEKAQEAKVSALLGSKYPKWEEYQSTAQARVAVDQLRSALAASGNPLSEVQSKALVTAFAGEQRRSDKETREWSRSSAAINSPNMMQEMMQRQVQTQTRLVDVAAPILESAQLDRFKRQVEQQAAMLNATMGMMTGGGKP